ncbi:sugar ABC transporter permease, partial [Streptomyces sp. SID89]|nr:sugar ABC transporter permease [Streptomyces sp. SID89]
MTTTVPETGTRPVHKSSPGAARGPRRTGRIKRIGLPYLLLLPALILELLVHLVPMVIGIVMSFKELTQFYIRDWGTAPWSGIDNYKLSVDFDGPV